MSAAPLPTRMTVEEFLQRPKRTDGMQEELIDGELFVSPNAKPLHNDTAEYIYRKLLPLEDSGLWLVKSEVACRVTKESLPNTDACVVDRALWRQTRTTNDYFAHAPALAVEVESPSNTGRALRRKSVLYLEHGANQVWVVQPESRNIVVLTPEDDERIVGIEGTLEFGGLSIDVKGIFAV